MTAANLLLDTLDKDLQHAADMPLSYYEVLVRLSEAPHRTLRMSELAKNSQSSRSRLSHAVTRLEKTGWVRREACANDRRGWNAVLTDAGFAALRDAAPGHVDAVRSYLFDPLTQAQHRQLAEICAAITANLIATGAVAPDATGPGAPQG